MSCELGFPVESASGVRKTGSPAEVAAAVSDRVHCGCDDDFGDCWFSWVKTRKLCLSSESTVPSATTPLHHHDRQALPVNLTTSGYPPSPDSARLPLTRTPSSPPHTTISTREDINFGAPWFATFSKASLEARFQLAGINNLRNDTGAPGPSTGCVPP
jgi:hypothetical protein